MAKKNFRKSILNKAKTIRVMEDIRKEEESLTEGEKYILERKRERGESEPTLGEKLLQEISSSPLKVEQPEPIFEEIEVEQPEPIFEEIEEDTQVVPDWSTNAFAKVQESVDEQTDEDRISWYLEKVKDERVEVKGGILEQDLQNTPATMEQLANLRGVVTRLQTSLTSLGGGGIGYDEVRRLIQEGAYNIDSDDLTTLQENLQDYVLDQIEVGAVDSAAAISIINETVDSAFVNSLVDLPEYTTDDIDEGLNNKYYNTTLFTADFVSKSTDSLSEGSNNLYYTDGRVDARITAVVDSDYVMDRVTIDPAIDFKGIVSVADSDAPASPASGDLYVSDSDEIANATWVGVAGQLIVKQHGLVWSEADNSWHELGQTAIDTDLFLEKTGGTMTGNLSIDSADLNVNYGNITVKGTDKYIRAIDGAKLQSNTLRSVGNSNISISRNGERRLLIGTNSLVADKKIKYNPGYSHDSYTSDLIGEDSYTLMPKWYVDSSVGDAVSKYGDSMTGTLYAPTITIGPDSDNDDRALITFDPSVDSAHELEVKSDADIIDGWVIYEGVGRQNLRNVAYGDGVWVAVAYSRGEEDSRIMRSTNGGIDWTEVTTSFTGEKYFGVAYGDGKFVAVSDKSTYGNTIVYSTDLGLTWQEASGYAAGTETNKGYKGIAYGGGRFVAVADGGNQRVSYSTDGINWTNVTVPASDWQSVAYGDGTWVATAWQGSADHVMYSTDDAQTWTTTSSGVTTQQWFDVAYGDGKFVAAGMNPGNINRTMYSEDGINWTAFESAGDKRFVSVAYGNGLWVAGGRYYSGASYIQWSKDGINWNLADQSFNETMWGMSYANGVFIGPRDDGNVVRLLWAGGRGLYFNNNLVATESNLQPVFDALNQMASSIASLQAQIDDLTP